MAAFIVIILNAVLSKVLNDKQLPSCKKSDQNVEKNQSYETVYIDFNFVKDPFLQTLKNSEVFFIKIKKEKGKNSV